MPKATSDTTISHFAGRYLSLRDTTHLVPLDNIADFLSSTQARGLLVDFKIHACLGAVIGWQTLKGKNL